MFGYQLQDMSAMTIYGLARLQITANIDVNWVCYQSTTIWAISLKESGLKILGQATYHLHIAVINPVSTSFNSTFKWRGSIDGKGPTIWQLKFSGTPTYNCNLTQKVKITKFIEFIKKQVCTCKSDIIIPIKCQVKMSKIPSFSNFQWIG